MEDPRKLAKSVQKKMNQFLTEHEDENKDMNARITSDETLRALQLWRLLESKDIEEAGTMADTLERLTVSIGGEGRKEVVDAIKSVPSIPTKARFGGLQMMEGEEEE